MKLALDTNAYVAFRRDHRETVRLVQESESLVMSIVVVGELLYGFRHRDRFEANRQILEEFLDADGVAVIPVTEPTADRFGLVSAGLRRRGVPIPTNDIWIAAHVFESGARLATFDKHFRVVENLPHIILTAV